MSKFQQLSTKSVSQRFVEQRLTSEQYSRMLAILHVQSKTGQTEVMRSFIRDMSRSIGYRTQRHEGNLYVTKGTSPTGTYPCFVSHMDTVHAVVPDANYDVFYIPDKDLVPEECRLVALDPNDNTVKRGIGGDDKVGIFIALEMLMAIPYGKAAFFRDEESGGVGARQADMAFFDDCEFVIECDRRGSGDFVRNAAGVELSSDAFMEAIGPTMKEWGYWKTSGGLTDVTVLKEKGLGISACNMSCGYYNPHTKGEWVEPNHVAACLGFVTDITNILTGTVWTHTYEKPAYRAERWSRDNTGYAGIPSMSGNYRKWKVQEDGTLAWDDESKDEDEKKECWNCGLLLLGPEERSLGECSICSRNASATIVMKEDSFYDDCYAFYNSEDDTGVGADPKCPSCGDYCVQYDTEAQLYWCFTCETYFDKDERKTFGTDFCPYCEDYYTVYDEATQRSTCLNCNKDVTGMTEQTPIEYDITGEDEGRLVDSGDVRAILMLPPGNITEESKEDESNAIAVSVEG